jgi:putative lipoic acid-binding regulatory protein
VVKAPAPLTFPTDYPVKVVGRPEDGFRARVHAIVLRHAPALDAERVTERASANGKYVSISYLLRAESRAQIEALVAELKSCDGVMMLL